MGLEAGNAGTVEVDVVGEYSKFERGLKQRGTAAGGKFGSSFKDGFGSKMANLGAAAIATQFGRQMIDQASDLEEATNVTGLAFGEARGEVDALAASANETFGLAESEFRQMGAQIGNIFVGSGAAERDAARFTNELIGRATDMGSAWNASTQEVTESINSGLIGSFEPLRKYGVILDMATVKTKALEMGLATEGEELSANAKQLATYELIMEQTANVAGDFAATSDGVANSSKIVGAQWRDMQAQLGTGLLPVLSALLGITRQLGPEGMKYVVIGVAMAFMFTKVAFAVKALGGALKLLAANPWVLVALAIVAAGILIWKNWDLIVEKLAAAWDWVKMAAGELAAWFAARWEDVKRITSDVWNAISNFFVQWWPYILGIFTGGIGLVIGLIIQNWDAIWAKTTEIWNNITGFLGGVFSTISGLFDTFIITPITTVIDLFTSIPELARTAWNGVKSAIEAVAQWIVDKLDAIGAAADKALGPIDEIIGAGAKLGGGIFGAVGGVLGYDAGGRVPGPRGAPQLAVVHGGETILPTHKVNAGEATPFAPVAAGGGLTVNGPLMVVEGNLDDPGLFERHAHELVKVVNRELDRDRRGAGYDRGAFTP